MISQTEINNLIANWGDSMGEMIQKNAMIRIFDHLSKWECFLIAINPEDQDEVFCLLNGFHPELDIWRLTEIFECYNKDGDHPRIDDRFVPINARQLLQNLKEKRS